MANEFRVQHGIISNGKIRSIDSSDYSPLNIVPRSAPPSTVAVNDIYLDDGTNTSNGTVGWLRLASTGPDVWVDISVDTASVYLDATNIFTAEQTITIADGTNSEALTINQNDTTNNPDAILINNAGSGNSINVNSGEFVVEGDGTLSVGSALDYETLVTADDDIPNKKYVDDAISSASHTQNTDTGTTSNTFTVDSDSATGKIIVDVALGASDNSLTLTNAALDGDRVITFPNETGTVALTSDLHTQNTDTTITAGDSSVVVADAGSGTITFTVDAESQFAVSDGLVQPTTNDDIVLGDDTHRFAELHLNDLRLAGSSALTSVSTGAGDNDKLVTQGYVDDAVAAVDTLDEVAHNGSSITIADTENFSITINQNDVTNNPSALVISNTGSGSSLAVNTNEFLIEGDGTLSVAGVSDYETLVTADDDIPNKKYVDDAISTASHTQNTDTGTTENTFTIDSDSSDGKIILDVTNGGTDNSVTITNSVTTGDITLTLPDATGTFALTNDLHTQNTDTGTTSTSFDIASGESDGQIHIDVTGGGTDNVITLTNSVTTADRTITLPDASGTVALTSDLDNMYEYNPETANKSIYIECTSGNDTTGDGSSGSPYQTIGRALDDVEDFLGGFTVTIRLAEAGTYIQADLYSRLQRFNGRGIISIVSDTSIRYAAAADSGNFESETYMSKTDTDKAWGSNAYRGYFLYDIDRTKYLPIAGNTATKLYIGANGSFGLETIDNYSIHALACTVDADSAPGRLAIDLQFTGVNVPFSSSWISSQHKDDARRVMFEYCNVTLTNTDNPISEFYNCVLSMSGASAINNIICVSQNSAIATNRPIFARNSITGTAVVSYSGSKHAFGAIISDMYDRHVRDIISFDMLFANFAYCFGADITNYFPSAGYMIGGSLEFDNVDFIARVHQGVNFVEDPTFPLSYTPGNLNIAEVTDNGTTEATYYISVDDNYDASCFAPSDKVAIKQGLAENTDVDTGAEVIDSFPDTVNAQCVVWHYVVQDNDAAANRKTGTIQAIWEATGNSIDYNEYGIVELGDASDVTLSVDINSDTVRLLATTTSDNWSVKVKRILI